jgi:tetratricopeptide (TPR) repeat protein
MSGNFESVLFNISAAINEDSDNDGYFKGLRCLLMAKAYEAQENKIFAVKNYKESLKHNCENYEAFDRLISNFLLTNEDRLHLMDEVKFTEENLWLKDYYMSRIQQCLRVDLEGVMVKSEPNLASPDIPIRADMENEDPEGHSHLTPKPLITSPNALGARDVNLTQNISPSHEKKVVFVLDVLKENQNNDIKLIEAEKEFNGQNYIRAYEIIKSISEQDFYYLSVVPIFCATLIELNRVGELYFLAHKLVSANPELAISWYSVGSYYFLIKKYDLSRKYFNKANKLDKHFAASWIAFGHSFA